MTVSEEDSDDSSSDSCHSSDDDESDDDVAVANSIQDWTTTPTANDNGGEESKFAKKEQLFAQWGQTWLPVTIVAVFANNYYNVHWTLSGETTSVHEDELKPGSHK